MKDFKVNDIAQIILASGIALFSVLLGVGLVSWFN